MKMNSLEIKDRKAQLQKRCKAIIKSCREEIREMTDEEKQEIENAKQEIEQLKEELKALNKRLQEFDELEKDIEDTEVEDEEVVEEKNNIEEDVEEEIIEEQKRSINTMKKTKFRLLKAINDIANNRSLDKSAMAVVNAGAEEMRKSGLSYAGQIQLPVETRDITVASEHDDVIDLDMQSILAPLRAKNVLVNAGAKFLTNLIGDVQVPVMNGASVTWEGEVAEAGDAGVTYDSVKLQPKRLTAFVDVSKQFLVQDSIGAEEMLKQDIINAINTKLEATILGEDAGTATQPAGIFNGKTATTVSDFASVTKLEATVEDANVLGQPVYVMSNSAKAVFRAMAKSSKNTQLVMEGGEIDGVKCYNTSNVPANKFIYGDFNNLAIGQWGAIDLIIDPYTVAKEGKVRIVVNAYFDAKVLREEAFAVGATA